MWKNLQNPEHPEQKNEHMYRYRSSCTDTPCAKMGSGQPVPVQVEPVPVHPSSEQPVPVQVKAVPVQVVPVAPFLHVFASLSPVFVYRGLGTLRND